MPKAAVQDLKAQLEKPAAHAKEKATARKRPLEKAAAKATRPNKRPKGLKALKDQEQEEEEPEPEEGEFLGPSDVPRPPSESEDQESSDGVFTKLLADAEATFEDGAGSSDLERAMDSSDDGEEQEDEDADIFQGDFAEKKETTSAEKGLPSKVQALIEKLDKALVATFPKDLSECPAAHIMSL